MARTGRRMMPTFPSSPLKFRTAGFPQYGFKAGYQAGPSRGAPAPRLTQFAAAARAPRALRGALRSASEPRDRWNTAVRATRMSLDPRGPRSGPGWVVPVHPHLLGPIRPTPGHIAISPPCGLYAMPSLCVPTSATHEWFRAFAAPSVSACRPLRPRGVRRLPAPRSFALGAGFHPERMGSALPTIPPSASGGAQISGLHWFASLRPTELLASLADPTGFPQPTATFTSGLSTARSPFPPPDMTTVATGPFPPAELTPARTSASIAAPALLSSSKHELVEA
jgi:hypothetical protein